MAPPKLTFLPPGILKTLKPFFSKYLKHKNIQKTPYNLPLIKYFDKYESFCFDLTPDSVLSGDLNFTYK